YPPAQTQEPTGVPVIPINSFSEPQMTPAQVDQVQRDLFGEAFSGANRFAERDPSQQDEAFRRITTGVTAQPPVIEVIHPRFIPQQPPPPPPPSETNAVPPPEDPVQQGPTDWRTTDATYTEDGFWRSRRGQRRRPSPSVAAT
ncbi:MAG: hypothetical protein ACKPKO_13210, partial [Candidatus Fonsibacter sp.]